MVVTLKSKSGFAWDDEKDMNMMPDMEEAWEALVKVCEYVRVHSVNDSLLLLAKPPVQSVCPCGLGIL